MHIAYACFYFILYNCTSYASMSCNLKVPNLSSAGKCFERKTTDTFYLIKACMYDVFTLLEYKVQVPGGSGTFVHVSVDSTKFYYELNEEPATSCSILVAAHATCQSDHKSRVLGS